MGLIEIVLYITYVIVHKLIGLIDSMNFLFYDFSENWKKFSIFSVLHKPLNQEYEQGDLLCFSYDFFALDTK